MSALVRSVNVGLPQEAAWAEIGRTSIDKHAVNGLVRVRRLGLEGDQVSDTRHHGGVDQAVYAFAREDLDAWAERLGRDVRDGQFGENLTTEGIDVNEAEVGEHWRIGTAVLEVASIRIPCKEFKCWMGESGYDRTAWVKRFAAVARPGPYLRVVEEGALSVGDPIEVVRRPGHGVTVSTMFRALTTDRELLPELLRVDGLVDEAREKAETYVAARG
ncbi:MOSC domain-containing protein [Nocardioides guangzhouensis]|uniref:MOSC domain-containing protein n=1 Tax=Nocardioides guangzhouensis TaxID=2497878 RepID=A0A4Q4ZEM0_9ACTN|nr:MOSC domain-containing protein [Nocardioides guangzhouensis]RYP86523.1 MOSC domain-containing protein [Nocardioides guangzhouensis]